jgi:diacylglycerol kinase (ATP)
MDRPLLKDAAMSLPPATTAAPEGRSDATGASEPTLDAFTRLTSADRAGQSRFHRLTNPVAALRQLGAVRRAVIVVNDLAPGAHAAVWKTLFRETLGAHVELTEVRVRHFEGALAAARGAAAWGAELVIAIGGDGTVNACVNGLGDSATRLAVVPAGTANDLAHLVGQHGIPTEDAVTMASWERKDIDAIDVNGTRYYSAGGLGWVADVAHTANRWRAGGPLRRWLLARLGSLIYTLACVAVILGKQRLGARAHVRYLDARDGQEHTLDLDAYGVLVASSKKVGRSFHLAPVSEMDDGRFELIFFPKVRRRRLLYTVLQAQRGKLFEIPEIRYVQVTRAEIVCDRRVRFFGDGEILEHGDRFALGIAREPVKIMAPGLAEPAVALHLALERA